MNHEPKVALVALLVGAAACSPSSSVPTATPARCGPSARCAADGTAASAGAPSASAEAERRKMSLEFVPVAAKARAQRSWAPLLAFARRSGKYALEWSVLVELGASEQDDATLAVAIPLLEERAALYEAQGPTAKDTLATLLRDARARRIALAWAAVKTEADRAAVDGDPQRAVKLVRAFRDEHPASSVEPEALALEGRHALGAARPAPEAVTATEDEVARLRAIAESYKGTPAATEAQTLAEEREKKVLEQGARTEDAEPVEADTMPPDQDVAEEQGAAPGPGYAWEPGDWSAEGDDWSWTPGRWRRVPVGWIYVATRYELVDGRVRIRRGYWSSKPVVVVKAPGVVYLPRKTTKIVVVKSSAKTTYKVAGKSWPGSKASSTKSTVKYGGFGGKASTKSWSSGGKYGG